MAPPASASLQQALHQRLRITTKHEAFDGFLFCIHDNTLVLVSPSTPSTQNNNTHNFHIIAIKEISDFSIISDSDVAAPVVEFTKSIEKCVAKERDAVMKQVEKDRKLGVGVSAEAQTIFNILSKTMPTRWLNDIIIVMDDVHISPPYSSSSCRLATTANVNGKPTGGSGSGDSSKNALLKRVKMILDEERKRLGI